MVSIGGKSSEFLPAASYREFASKLDEHLLS